MKPLRVRPALWFKLIMGCCVVIYAWRSVGVWNESGDLFALMPSVLCMALGVHLLFTHGSVEMTAQVVRLVTLTGSYEIAWDEVKSIQTDTGTLVLFGENKKLVIPGMSLWSGPDRTQMMRLFDRQVSSRLIPITQTWKSAFGVSKGTKIKA